MRLPVTCWPAFLCLTAAALPAQESLALDLRTTAGLAAVRGEWRYHDATLVPVAFRRVGPDRKPSGEPNTTLEVMPRAGVAAFDDAAWERIPPTDLEGRRGQGRVCFGWYRLAVTVPDRIGDVPLQGGTLSFTVTIDDYAEVWVDGLLPRRIGQPGGSLVAGFNVGNQVLLTHRAVPGQTFQIAVFAMNGPISDPPANYLWMRDARLLFEPTPGWGEPQALRLERLDPRLDAALAPGLLVEKVSDGHEWLEGPAWDAAHGRLLFSDIPKNRVMQWAPGAGTAVFLQPSGWLSPAAFPGREPGANGLAFGNDGHLLLCQHGERRLARLLPDGVQEPVMAAYEGKRLNSPNDVFPALNGDLYVTDPPFGLPRQFDDPARELSFGGVYRRTPDGVVRLLVDDLRGPNGVALSPDGGTMYVSDADPERPAWHAYALGPDGRVAGHKVLRDAAEWKGVRPGFPDGMAVDTAGHLFSGGPGGLYVFHPDGTLLGVLHTGVATSNCAFGPDLRTLFVTADHAVLALRW